MYQGAGGQEGVWAVRFDLSRREVVGEPFRLATVGTGPTVSNDGTLAYKHVVGGRSALVWIDRDGTVRHTVGQPQDDMSSPAISPDGTRIAVVGSENGTESASGARRDAWDRETADIWPRSLPRPTRVGG